MTPDELRALPACVPVWPEAGRAFGIGRSLTFDLARRGELPVEVLHVGRLLRVRRSDLLAALGVADIPTADTG